MSQASRKDHNINNNQDNKYPVFFFFNRVTPQSNTNHVYVHTTTQNNVSPSCIIGGRPSAATTNNKIKHASTRVHTTPHSFVISSFVVVHLRIPHSTRALQLEAYSLQHTPSSTHSRQQLVIVVSTANLATKISHESPEPVSNVTAATYVSVIKKQKKQKNAIHVHQTAY